MVLLDEKECLSVPEFGCQILEFNGQILEFNNAALSEIDEKRGILGKRKYNSIGSKKKGRPAKSDEEDKNIIKALQQKVRSKDQQLKAQKAESSEKNESLNEEISQLKL